jgi:hypothetical protein
VIRKLSGLVFLEERFEFLEECFMNARITLAERLRVRRADHLIVRIGENLIEARVVANYRRGAQLVFFVIDLRQEDFRAAMVDGLLIEIAMAVLGDEREGVLKGLIFANDGGIDQKHARIAIDFVVEAGSQRIFDESNISLSKLARE